MNRYPRWDIRSALTAGFRKHPTMLATGLASLLAIAGCGGSPMTLSVTAPPTAAPSAAISSHEMPPSTPTTLAPESAPATIVSASKDTAGQSESDSAASDSTVASVSKSDGDSKPPFMVIDPQQLAGRWRDSFYGKRTLTILPEGKATMLCEPDLAGRLLYGRQIEFDLDWSLEALKLTFKITSGRPMATAGRAIQAWGETFEYAIQAVKPDELRVVCNDGTTVYTFRRLDGGAEILPDSPAKTNAE